MRIKIVMNLFSAVEEILSQLEQTNQLNNVQPENNSAQSANVPDGNLDDDLQFSFLDDFNLTTDDIGFSPEEESLTPC